MKKEEEEECQNFFIFTINVVINFFLPLFVFAAFMNCSVFNLGTYMVTDLNT